VVEIFFEERTYVPREIGETPEDEEILAWHFDLRDEMEEKYFFDIAKEEINDIPQTTCAYGDLSSDVVLKRLQEINPDTIAVFGTSVIKDNIIEAFSEKIINLHLGLSPYYRGSGTNFWALYNDEPEYVGATVHFLDKGIDTGEIIHHARPDIEEDDNQHSIGCKTIIAGTDKLIKAVGEKLNGTIQSHEQWKEGIRPFCYRKHFTPEIVREFKKKLENGLIKNYVAREKSVANSFKLIS